MLILVQQEKEQGQVHIFQDIFQKFSNTQTSNNVSL